MIVCNNNFDFFCLLLQYAYFVSTEIILNGLGW